MRQSVLLVACTVTVSSLAATSAGTHAGPWPAITAATVEDAIRQADGAFLAHIEILDIAELSGDHIEGSGRITSKHAIWGQVPFASIELHRRRFSFSGLFGSNLSLWDTLGPRFKESRGLPAAVVSSGQGSDTNFLYVVLPEKEKGSVDIDDLLLVRAFELDPDTPQLHEQLIDIVVARESSELLWSYALRRLYRLEKDIALRFDLVLHPRIQVDASTARLWYAIRLLNGDIIEMRQPPPSSQDTRTILEKLLRAIESAPSANMAQQALWGFLGNPVKRAQYTEQEWDVIRTRIRAAISNPEHAIHKLSAERRDAANTILERLLGEPNLLKEPE